jgi:hypothetical protein
MEIGARSRYMKKYLYDKKAVSRNLELKVCTIHSFLIEYSLHPALK